MFGEKTCHENYLRFFNYASEIKGAVLAQLHDESCDSYFTKLSSKYDSLTLEYCKIAETTDYSQTCANFMKEVYALAPIPDTM